MVVREDPDSAAALCIPQSQHAAISGQIARAWGSEEFPAPDPFEDVCEAAARHDDGMDDFDSEPDLDPDTGLPRDFMRMPLDRWLECWRHGPSIVAEDAPYAGILVSLHGVHLLGYRRLDQPGEAEAATTWLAEQEELREEWSGDAERDPETAPGLGSGKLERNRALIAAWDAMSLAVCMPRLPDAFEDVPGAEGLARIGMDVVDAGADPFDGPRVISVDPWPFSEPSVDLLARGRLLERRFEERAAMQEALAAAPLRTLSATLVPGG